MNPFTPDLFAVTAPCMPCCSAPGECACALDIPPFQAPFVDYATALSVVSDPLAVADCLAFIQDSTALISAFSASDSGTAMAVSAAFASPVTVFGESWISLSSSAGDTYSVAYTGGSNITVTIYDCNGTEIEVVNASSSPAVSSALPADGIYYIKVSVFNPPMSGTFSTASFTVTPSAAYSANPVVALWDDSGTTRRLEACPKMLLPPLTEDTGDWYADETEAQAAIDDNSSSCIGYTEYGPRDSFVAVYIFGTLGMGIETPDSPPSVGPMWGSINAEAGETITVNSPSGQFVGFEIYDYDGGLVQSIPATGNTTETSSVLPYTGRYIISVSLNDPGSGPSSWGAEITSSGTMTVNPIQALYDIGLSCPARLDCS